MNRYRVVDYFQWGSFSLEKGQYLLVEIQDDRTARVSIESAGGQSWRVNPQAIDNMVRLKKIEKQD